MKEKKKLRWTWIRIPETWGTGSLFLPEKQHHGVDGVPRRAGTLSSGPSQRPSDLGHLTYSQSLVSSSVRGRDINPHPACYPGVGK